MAPARSMTRKPVGTSVGVPRRPIEVMSDWPEKSSFWAPAVVRKMLGCPPSAVESSTVPTMRNGSEPISTVSPTRLSIRSETATSSVAAGGRPSDRIGMPGPPWGAPNTLTLRAESPSGMVALP